MNEGEFLQSRAIIDCCVDCGGAWFDKGELNRTLNMLKRSHDEDAPKEDPVNLPPKQKSKKERMQRKRELREASDPQYPRRRKQGVLQMLGFGDAWLECTECSSGILEPFVPESAGTTVDKDGRRSMVSQFYQCDQCGYRKWINH